MEKIGQIFREYTENRLKENLTDINCFFILKYSGVKASQLNILRQSLNDLDSKLFVSKNSVSRRVLLGMGFEQLSNLIEGPCGIAYGNGDAVDIAKALHTFIKTNENLKIEGGTLKEKVLSKEEVAGLAKLPSKAALQAKLVGVLASPMTGLACALNGIIKKFVYCLDQIKQKKSK